MIRVVTTLTGTRYKLTRELGRGGQGAVFGADDGRHAVKLLRMRSPVAREALRDRLAMVARLPIDDLGLARPLDRLREPDLGYVMELITGMEPIHTLLRPPREAASLTQWYLAGGGLRRRLRLLARTADLFARLHGRGLVYTDPSPQNIFVSQAIDAHEVRLIDTDNLRPASVTGEDYFTPGYGAPELNTGRGPATSLSDAHAFAVIAFQTLALVHPLQGDLVEDGEPELQVQAFNGDLPWIDHPQDKRNRSRHGIARGTVLSRHLSDICAASFGPGLKDLTRRPGLTRWAEYLHRAADNTLCCQACSGTFFRTSPKCPWCEAPRSEYLSIDCELWDPQRLVTSARDEEWKVKPGSITQTGTSGRGKAKPIDSAVIGVGEELDLTDRFTVDGTDGRPQLRLRHRGTELLVEALEPGTWRLISFDGRGDRSLTQAPAAIPLDRESIQWFLRTGESNRLHRIIRFRKVEGA